LLNIRRHFRSGERQSRLREKTLLFGRSTMMYQPRLNLVEIVVVLTIVLVPLAAIGQLAAAQFQTREPPLPGAQPGQIPPPPPRPKIIQQPQPVPVMPAPAMPPQMMPTPSSVVPHPSPAAPFMEVPCPPVDPPTPLVKLRVRVAACSAAGQEIEYHITAENCSAASAHHVLVRNPLPDNCRFVRAQPEPSEKDPELIWTFGTLCAGESREIVLVLAPTDANDVKNCARVQFEHGQCVVTRIAKAPPAVEPPSEPPARPRVEKETPKVVPSGTAKLDLKITGPKLQYANLSARYQIVVTNIGDGAAENLVLNAALPENSSFQAASDNAKFHFGQAAWPMGNLPPGSSKTVEVTYRMLAAGEACIKASALADSGVRTEAEACTKFEGASALHLDTIDTSDPVHVGGETSYRITVFNQGSVDLTNIQVRVLVPREMTLLRAAGATTPPPPEQLPPSGPDGQTLNFAALKALKPGEKQVYEVFVRASRPGDARWRTTLTADQLTGGPVVEEESTTVFKEDERR
jgi:uncharacterized repeat protein (TIGR01451 family)